MIKYMSIVKSRLLRRGSLARKSISQNLDDDTKAHIKEGKTLNMF